ncbi:MAG: Rieske 2Fe-2S domain-containing protein [Vicinamibacteria bacterium]|jgi:Rieske Fe-S protein|nr:Rieske 2Fe-2S domain-containing protein [Vicinamibacteria bacterium]MBP9948167.1 Rieske 2Fe-2S domain-containing protein [Vicinamibacteria bacterium]
MLIDRRALLRSWQALLAAVAALSAIPAGLVFVFGGRAKDGASDAATEWIDLGPARDVTEGPWMARKFPREIADRWKKTVVEESVYLRRRAAAIEAISASCTHTGCLVRQVTSGFACLCHRSDFDEEGKPKAGPAPRPLDRLETKVEGERLKLRFVKFRPGLSHSEPMVS